MSVHKFPDPLSHRQNKAGPAGFCAKDLKGQVHHLRSEAHAFAENGNEAGLTETLLEINRVRVLAEWPARVAMRDSDPAKAH